MGPAPKPPTPNPQSPIPNPQSPKHNCCQIYKKIIFINLNKKIYLSKHDKTIKNIFI
jgi:hypothetical protein